METAKALSLDVLRFWEPLRHSAPTTCCAAQHSAPDMLEFILAAGSSMRRREFMLQKRERNDPVRSSSVLLNIVKFARRLIVIIALASPSHSFVMEKPSDIPDWLRPHVGERDGQIAPVVLQRARALYFKKVDTGVVRNPCYFAMDATRPHRLDEGKVGARFYIICESARSYRAISASHGGGRDLKGVADFTNGKRCAKNFGNARDSFLTAGGSYVTAETRTSFKGYYSVSANKDTALIRSFVQFDGEGETANARQREIGGHPAELLRNVCLRKDPHNSFADRDGYVPFGQLENYTDGRSDGCTSWSLSDAEKIIAMVKDDPTTLYIYPAAADIDAVTQAMKASRSLSQAGLYWNASCLKEIAAPKFWSKETLEPVLAQYTKIHPAPPQRPPPLCKAAGF
jgi:hypothetical protein